MSQQITIVGNLVTDPERRRTNAGGTVAGFRVACNDRIKDANGNWVDGPPSFYAVSAFRGLAEHVLTSLHKGQRVLVLGSLHLRTWDTGTKTGVSVEIDADAVGPDLLWGTATFSRDVQGRAGGADERADPAAVATVDAGSAPSPEAVGASDSGLGVTTGWAAEPLEESVPF
ncbi:single-stranded DNA-binding protein [Microbacterium telephonicum]|uniref:Single-stranded DNA-binding protein n=1 Tax=Microbacterium telephonicum TaxID=1714841 RepID=A0A498C414_9MICO|nr:single-stranded DNA-binding protein [Microbacterium telephonicum]RLK49286.1 single-strand DNA-binding protein [Microbacterium telephonicum]